MDGPAEAAWRMLTEGFPDGVAHRRDGASNIRKRMVAWRFARAGRTGPPGNKAESLTAAEFQFHEASDAKFDGAWYLDMCWCWSCSLLPVRQVYSSQVFRPLPSIGTPLRSIVAIQMTASADHAPDGRGFATPILAFTTSVSAKTTLGQPESDLRISKSGSYPGSFCTLILVFFLFPYAW